MTNSIGIGVSTRNRREVANKTIEQIKKFMPKVARLVIVDDASDVPFPNADYRFETNAGIAVAKNKCLELLEDCEHIFLFDDDCCPICHASFDIYVESILLHAMFIFDRKILSATEHYVEYEKPRGCMLYINNKCLKYVGGFDTDFEGYSYEHPNFSDRVFNNGLTPKRYIDVTAISLFELADTPSSVAPLDRLKGIRHNEKLYKERYLSSEFKPYK